MRGRLARLILAGTVLASGVIGLQVHAEAKKSNLMVAVVSSYLNIRQDATTSSESIGRLYNGGGGRVLESGKEWTKIKSGSVVGYVNNEYILTGDKAIKYLEKHNDKVATVTASSLNIRSKMSVERSDVLRVARKANP